MPKAKPGPKPKPAPGGFNDLPRQKVAPPVGDEPPSQAFLREIYSYLRKGAPWAYAAMGVGISPDDFDRWMEMGLQPDAQEPYRSFSRRVYKITADLVVAATAAMLAGARKKNPLAVRAFIDMRFPNGINDTRGDGRADPLSSKQTKRLALGKALRRPPPELKAVMEEADVIALTEAQRAALEDAGLLAPRKLLQEPEKDTYDTTAEDSV